MVVKMGLNGFILFLYYMQELNEYRYNQNRPKIDPDDLDQDGEPDHLTATKHKIDEYIAKQVKGTVC